MTDIMIDAKEIIGLTKEQVIERLDDIRYRYANADITEYKRFDELLEAMMLSQALMKYAQQEIDDDRHRRTIEEFNKIFNNSLFGAKNTSLDDKDRPAPNRFHTDGDGSYYDDFGTGLGGQPEEDMNTNAWSQVPKGDDMKYWQNKYGQRTWVNNTTKLQAQRSYYWCDRVIIMDDNRRVLDDITFTKFIRTIYGNDNWVAEDGKAF